MYISKNLILYLVLILLLTIVEAIKPGFDPNDGFYAQMKYIQEHGFEFNLTLIHALRYVVMYPFIVFKNSSNYFFLISGLFIYTLPYYLFLKNNRISLQKLTISLLLILFLFMFSERTFLSILGGFYLFLYFTEIKNKYFLLYGFFFSLLSSGNVMVFIIYILMFSNYVFEKKKILKTLTIVTTISIFSFSLIHKYDFFLNQADGLLSLITRATLFVSYEYHQVNRFLFVSIFLVSIFTVIYILLLNLKLTTKNTRAVLFLFISLITFLFEGITFYSYLLVFIYVLMNYFTFNNNKGFQHV